MTFWDAFCSLIHTNSSLSNVDKFNYLVSLLEAFAAEAITGLSITSANYDEAFSTLKKRFGNSQTIISRHMEALLGIGAVSSHHNIKGVQKLNDTVEMHVRGLRALGVSTESYAGTTNNTGSTTPSASCTYCGQNHSSPPCNTVKDISAKKEIFRKVGRCYICL